MLLLVPLLMVMLFFRADSLDPQLLRRTLICVLLGQVHALTTVGFKLAGFIRKIPQGLPTQ